MPLRQLVQPAFLAGSAIFLTLCAPALAEDAAALPTAEGNAARTGEQVFEAQLFARCLVQPPASCKSSNTRSEWSGMDRPHAPG